MYNPFKHQLKMKTTKENPTLDIVRYIVAGLGGVCIVAAIIVTQLH